MVDELNIQADVSGKSEDAPVEQTQNVQSDRPEWLPEKFKSAEELAKSYTELEKSFSEKSQATANDLNPFFDEYSEKGELTQDSYNKLNGMGLSKDVVDNYISGMKAQTDLQVTRIQNEVGGESNYNNMVKWAQDNLSEAEVNAFNKSIESGNSEEALLAVKGVNARYNLTQAPKTNEPSLIKGQAAAPQSNFRSTAEVVKAINDPRYKEDSAYRKDVEDKIKRSNITL